MRLAHDRRLTGALGSCYGFRVDTENIFRCSSGNRRHHQTDRSVLTQVTRTLGIRAKNSSSIKDTNALRDSADDGQTPKVAGAAETRICNPRLVLM